VGDTKEEQEEWQERERERERGVSICPTDYSFYYLLQLAWWCCHNCHYYYCCCCCYCSPAPRLLLLKPHGKAPLCLFFPHVESTHTAAAFPFPPISHPPNTLVLLNPSSGLCNYPEGSSSRSDGVATKNGAVTYFHAMVVVLRRHISLLL